MQSITIAVKSFEKTMAKLRTVVSYEAASDEDEQGQNLVVALSFCRLLGLGCPKQAFAKIATLSRLFFNRQQYKYG